MRGFEFCQHPGVSFAESCAYGSCDAESILLSLFVDDGVPSRGHRANLLAPYSVIGAGCGPWQTGPGAGMPAIIATINYAQNPAENDFGYRALLEQRDAVALRDVAAGKETEEFPTAVEFSTVVPPTDIAKRTATDIPEWADGPVLLSRGFGVTTIQYTGFKACQDPI